ncbi:hypothetical protein N9D31_00595 [Oligoflexaceae bacterium]|nr:hypothetical protein [Oligoflexaceae bacterium]
MKYSINLKPTHRRRPYRVLFFILMSVVMFEFVPSVAMATDIGAVSIPSSTGLSAAHSAQTLEPGAFGIGLDTRSSTIDVGEQSFTDGQGKVSVQRYDLTTGIGLTRFLDLHLSFGAASQSYDADARESVFSGVDQKEIPQSDFTGVTGLLKLQLLQSGRLAFAVAPFAESGSGSNGKYSLVRSQQAKAGWLAMLTYGEKGMTKADFNFGYRYRSTETVGNYRLRNEMFYSAAVTAYVVKNFGLFLSGKGRSIQASDDRYHVAGQSRDYKGLDTAEVTGGLVAHVGNFTVSAYGGKRIQDQGIGFGSQIAGLKLTYHFGEESRPAQGKSFISHDRDRDDNEEVIADLSNALAENQKKNKGEKVVKDKKVDDVSYDFFENYDKETKGYLADEGKKSDRVLIREELNRQKKDPSYKGASEEDIRNAELTKLENAEKAKIDAENRERKLEELENRKTASQRLKQEEAQYNNLREELSDDLKALPEFDTIDIDFDE